MTASDSLKLLLISVIVPTHNNSQELMSLLPLLCDQNSSEFDYEIIIVNNLSTDSTKAVCGKFPVKYVEENTIQSSYAARNKGISISKGEVYVFIDSDCTPTLNWLNNLVQCMKINNADMVGGSVVFYEDKSISGIYDSITNIQMRETILNRNAALTANLLITKETIYDAGLFDSQAISGGDITTTYLATQKGHKLVYCDNAIVYHPTRSFYQLFKKALRTSTGKKYWKNKSTRANAISPPALGLSSHLNFMRCYRKCMNIGFHVPIYKVPLVYLFHIFLLSVSLANKYLSGK